MIVARLEGQLGNQLFQYAAARIQAEKLGVGFALIKAGATRRQHLSNAIGRREWEIFEVFPDLKGRTYSRAASAIAWASPRLFSFILARTHCYTPPLGPPDLSELYSEDFWSVEPRTRLSGFFQSILYWGSRVDDVRSWFVPGERIEREVALRRQSLPTSPEAMVAVHIRLGDYLTQRGFHGQQDTGWALDPEYYRAALSAFDSELPIALFTDDPDRALAYLPRRPAWISPAGQPGPDLLMMGLFPNLIISNSSFSWWAAMLRKPKDGVVVAPEYHLGRMRGIWYPRDVRVPWWRYV